MNIDDDVELGSEEEVETQAEAEEPVSEVESEVKPEAGTEYDFQANLNRENENKPKLYKVRATRFSLLHPYLKVRIGQEEFLPVGHVDNWLECQKDAGLLEVVEQ